VLDQFTWPLCLLALCANEGVSFVDAAWSHAPRGGLIAQISVRPLLCCASCVSWHLVAMALVFMALRSFEATFEATFEAVVTDPWRVKLCARQLTHTPTLRVFDDCSSLLPEERDSFFSSSSRVVIFLSY
jgi:hypothetical protein